MNESNHFTARASLAALGQQFQHLAIWSVVAAHVEIKQKTLKYRLVYVSVVDVRSCSLRDVFAALG